jgi:DNA-binding protein HU-beta
MTRSDLIAAVSTDAGLSHAAAGRAIDALLDVIRAETAAGRPVAIRNFGTFRKRHRSAREVRNPQTGAPVAVPASDVLAFRASRPARA